MDREQALRRLSEGHARVLRLRQQGLDDETIAQRVGIPVEGVQPMLQMAAAKLAALLARAPVEAVPRAAKQRRRRPASDREK